MPETAIFDHYEVLTRDDGSLFELGRGAMGITYKAFDTSLRIPVALKVINSTYLNSEVARERFVREARSAAKLRHRNVATVFHLGTEGETWFYAMEFIDGETLDGLIRRQGTLPPVVALNITEQVARALNAAAQHELVHRDIKPANLMLVKEDEELVAKVIDFGLAKTSAPGEGEDAATLSMGGFVGTPHFASPEQLEDKEIDVRSDIYSLGVTLWYMLAGQAPFAGSMAQVMSQHLSKPPPFEKLDTVPVPVAEVLKKMLEKNPADRFQTPGELRKAIEEALDAIADLPAPAARTAETEENFATLLEETPGSGTNFETNTAIAGRYRIAESLGQTNAGRVYRAYDSERQREVRLLVLPSDAMADPAALTGLEREAEKVAKVSHPNVLGVFDFETVERGSFLVLEWTDGFSVLELLKARRELEADEALKLLAQAAAGVDHALGAGLTGLEFGLHQIQIHFPQPIEKETILHAPVGQWPAFELKLYPLGTARDIAASQTWAGGQTMVGGAASAAGGGDARPRYLQALAAVIYELLGGTLSPLVLRGAGGPTMRYTPLSTLSEEGNEVLHRALDPARSYPTAGEFSDALSRIDGLQVRRHESKVAQHASHAPASSRALAGSPPSAVRMPGSMAPGKAPPSPPPVASFVPPERRKTPIVLFGGIAAALTVGVAAFLFLSKPTPDPAEAEPTPVVTPQNDTPEITPSATPAPLIAGTHPTTPRPATPMPATPPPAPTRQDLLKSAVDNAQRLEDQGNFEKSLGAWLKIAKEYSEFPVGKLHLETLLSHLRERPSPITKTEFYQMRAMITEAAELDVVSAMVLLGDNLAEAEPHAAVNWLSMAVAKGNFAAMNQLGLMYAKGLGVPSPDYDKAFQLFQATAEKGDIGGKALLADCYLLGQGVPAKDENRAIELYRAAAASGHLRSLNRLGALLRARGGAANFAEAVQLFSKAVEKGSADGCGNLGVLYLNGEGVAASDTKAVALFEKGAQLNSGFCMRLLAQCYEAGRGVRQNLLQTQNWYRKAAEAGDSRAAEWCTTNGIPFTPKRGG